MKSINVIITEIEEVAKQQIINAVWDRVAQINSALDDARGSALGEHYGIALCCAGEAVNSYMELVELCKQTTEQPLREHIRDALGSVKWENFELPVEQVGLWCNKITKSLKGDFDGDIPFEKEYLRK